MTWAVKQKVGNATGKAVLMMLANYADAEGRCFPSQETLASDSECNVRSVARWLSILERMGLIVREHRRRDDGYRTSDSIRMTFSDAILSPDTKSPDNKSPDTVSNLTGHKVRARTSQVNRKVLISARDELSKVLDESRVTAVLEHRQKLRKPLTAHAATLLAKTLSQHPDPNAAADEMIERGWQSYKLAWTQNAPRGSPRRREDMVSAAQDLLTEFSNANLRSPESHPSLPPPVRDISAPGVIERSEGSTPGLSGGVRGVFDRHD